MGLYNDNSWKYQSFQDNMPPNGLDDADWVMRASEMLRYYPVSFLLSVMN